MLNIQNARSREQLDKMRDADNKGLCPFCKQGLIEIHGRPVLSETDNFYVTENAFPYEGTIFHYLIIPKEHIKAIGNLTVGNWGEISILFQWLELEKGVINGALFLRFGDSAHPTSSVEHLHFHVIAGDATEEDETDRIEPIRVKLAYRKKTYSN